MQHHYEIHGMHCGSCVGKVERALALVDGVSAVEVKLDPPQARVAMERHVPTDDLNAGLAKAGDYLVEITPEHDRPPASANTAGAEATSGGESLYPLVLIVAFIAGTVVLIAAASSDFSPMTLMRHFMAGFFIVFSFFKLLDPPGFAAAYRGYDLLARRSAAWAWAYPFVELALGVSYLLNLWPIPVNVVTLILMLVGAAGVLRALVDKRTIRCACLGTALNLPMTKVKLVEDLTMAAMAAGMLVWHLTVGL
ncbi:MAG: heavy-metal-associated domain-containing protein [Planctomycetota bacterium]